MSDTVYVRMYAGDNPSGAIHRKNTKFSPVFIGSDTSSDTKNIRGCHTGQLRMPISGMSDCRQSYILSVGGEETVKVVFYFDPAPVSCAAAGFLARLVDIDNRRYALYAVFAGKRLVVVNVDCDKSYT